MGLRSLAASRKPRERSTQKMSASNPMTTSSPMSIRMPAVLSRNFT
jgi:hypothetical protein